MGKYKLQSGENIWEVARLFGTTAEEIARLNNTNDPFSMKVGSTVNVPDTSPSTSSQASTDLNDTATTPSAPIAPNTPTYNTTQFLETEEGKKALANYTDAQDALSSYGSFYYGNQNKLDEIMNSILNREKFSYDFNEDAFYQMYKDKYQKQGKMASANVMGQAAAMTGGYGNSYAATAGNQAYLASLQNLNDIIPELYQMAYDKYNQEGQNLYNQYGMLSDDYDRAYSRYSDGYNQLVSNLNTARDTLYDQADYYNQTLDNYNSTEAQKYKDAWDIYQSELDAYNAANAPKEVPHISLNDWNKIYEYARDIAEDGLNPLMDYLEPLVQNKIISPELEAQIVQSYYPSTTSMAGGGEPVDDTPKSSTNLMDFNRDQYSKNVQEHGGSYYGTVLDDLKEMKENGASNKTAQTYLAELVANSLITGSEYSNLYNQYRDNKLK